ncbi:MAG: 2-C-methyl-D-erythritol 4-phosphate cytidylyltransferase [Bacteroidales bacterium]|nr:2-C-methyl-D-erythritol 4-phosphate cytidylyltransferase [Bacteroidales bacterium]MBR5054587.1 2-C-methyl-D-erythritol 4-phosphate cytidylyltransferase [Bacteroidales bacterium]
MAAGHGARMGSALPKQFIELGGKPILQRTIECFVRAVPDLKVVTVLPKEYMQGWKDLCTRNNFYYPQILVEGGITRFHSVRNALKKVPDGAVVAIQDGVRPLLTPELAARMFERMDSCRALIPVLPSIDTLKALRRVRNAAGEETLETIPDVSLDRETVFRAQTPQMFLSEDIKAAYDQAFDTSFTDDASVAQRKNIPLSYIEGERYNIKITTQDDLDFAKAILSLRNWP